jgi:hypothetical protein
MPFFVNDTFFNSSTVALGKFVALQQIGDSA